MCAMSPRERLTATLQHRRPDRVPRDAWFTPRILEDFHRHTDATDPAAHYGFEHRHVGLVRTRVPADFSRYLPPELPAGTRISEWGEANVPGGFHHCTIHLQPLARMQTVQDLEAYPWPDVEADYRYALLEPQVRALHQDGYFVIGNTGHMGWEKACYLRGILNVARDLLDNPDFATWLLDRLCTTYCLMARRYAEAGVDMIWLSEDVAMQDRLMISPQMYRQWIKPRTKKVIDAARQVNPAVYIAQHHCGRIEPLIPDLIEIGVDALHPIQPECMDPVALKRRYGEALTLWGTVGAQSVLPFGTADDVRRTVRDNIAQLGYDGGLWIAPSQALGPEVPWENVTAFFEAVDEYG